MLVPTPTIGTNFGTNRAGLKGTEFSVNFHENFKCTKWPLKSMSLISSSYQQCYKRVLLTFNLRLAKFGRVSCKNPKILP